VQHIGNSRVLQVGGPLVSMLTSAVKHDVYCGAALAAALAKRRYRSAGLSSASA
jgi:hypothetical protein